MSTYPGSADNGATDLEYSPTPERIVSAADQRHEDHERRIEILEDLLGVWQRAQLGDGARIDDALVRIDQLEESVGQMQANSGDGLTAAYLLGSADGTQRANKAHRRGIDVESWEGYLRRLAARDPGGDADTLIKELQALRVFKATVPWDTLMIVKWRVAPYLPDSLEARYNAFSAWLAANAPEEAAE